MGLPCRLLSWDINSSQHSPYGHQCRSSILVCGAGAAQDVCAITLFQSPWPTCPSLSVLWSSHGGRTRGQIKCSSSSVWKRPSSSANASADSGEAQTIEQLWEEYFAHPSQWWDNRVDKWSSRSPDFKHKVTKKALWLDGWSTPAWVKGRLNSVTQGKLLSYARDSQDTAQPNRLPKDNNGQRNISPTSARELRQIVQGGDGSMHLQRARTTNEAISILKNRLEQGITIDSYMYVDVLKRCLKQKDLAAAKQVHDFIIKSGMEQNIYVANNLLSVYIRCGRLQDARQVFDSLVKKDVYSWNIMIGGHAQCSNVKDAMEVFNQMRQENTQADEITYLSILKACASPLALKWGKEVHLHIKHDGFESDVRVGTALLKMYAKCGSIKEARQVFDNLADCDVISWNVMIGAYAESGCGEDAYRLFLEMKREGFKPNAMTYVSMLNACASTEALEWVKEVHSDVLGAGLETDLRVGSALVHMYAKNGSINDARLVFDKMEERDVITWNVMIGAYTERGFGVEAHQLLLRMQREGFKPDAITYMSILNVSATIGNLEWVKDVHSKVLEAGLEFDLRVGIALVHMYAKSGSINDARLVFDRMEERDVVLWNVMIGAYAESGCGEEAHQLLLRMQREGFKPDAITFMNILNVSASMGALEWVKEVHSDVLRAGLESDLRVANALVHMYAKSGSIDDARLIFDRMKERDVISWNVIVGAYAEHGFGVQAYELFVQMQRDGFKPDAFSYVSLLNASGSTGALEWVKEVHSDVLGAGLESDLRVGMALVHMYAKCGSINDARLVFDQMEERDVITWNVMIGAYADCGCGVEAHQLLIQMQREGFKPDAITYLNILTACANTGALDWVKQVHSDVLGAGLESDMRLGNALVHMYAKSGSIDDARLVFDRMEHRNVVSFNVMIGGLAQHGCAHESLELFRKMKADGVDPDGYSFVAVLSGCSHAGLVGEGRLLFLAMSQDYGVEPTVLHYTCMVDLLGRAGHLEEAMLFIGDMPVEPDGATWGALLGACRSYGSVELGELAAKEVLKFEPRNASPYVLLSNIYAAAGKWEEVSLVRTMMQERGIHKEPGRSWIEVDNKIHDFFVGDISHPESKEIHAELNRLTERIKAEGYFPDTRLVLQNIDEEEKELALCSHSEKLAIAYGLLHTARGKPIRVYKNLRVCSDCHTATKFISKVTGREIVARDANRFHHFKEGVCSCGDYW